MIHHAVFGSLGRFIAMLLEHYGATLPFWLAPDQITVAPISRDQNAYAAEVLDRLRRAGLRAVLFSDGETLSRRIVAAHDAGIPVMAIVGRREAAEGSVTLRDRDGSQLMHSLSDAVAALSTRR
jgi:threonyl-tRNA synthetase